MESVRKVDLRTHLYPDFYRNQKHRQHSVNLHISRTPVTAGSDGRLERIMQAENRYAVIQTQCPCFYISRAICHEPTNCPK